MSNKIFHLSTIYPTPEQEKTLEHLCEVSRGYYNEYLEYCRCLSTNHQRALAFNSTWSRDFERIPDVPIGLQERANRDLLNDLRCYLNQVLPFPEPKGPGERATFSCNLNNGA